MYSLMVCEKCMKCIRPLIQLIRRNSYFSIRFRMVNVTITYLRLKNPHPPTQHEFSTLDAYHSKQIDWVRYISAYK